MDYPALHAFDVPADPNDMLASDMAALLEQTTGAARQAVGGAAAQVLAIASGVIVPTVGTVRVDTESNAATDDLDRVQATNMRNGAELLLWAENIAHVVTVKHGMGGTGQIVTADGADYVLDTAAKFLRLQRYGAAWIETGRAYEEIGGFAPRDAKLAVLEYFVMQLFGGVTSGVILCAADGTDGLKCVATGTPGMTVLINAGAGYLAGVPFILAAQATSAAMTAPLTNSRIDGIFLTVADGTVAIIAGTEAGSPTPPSTAPDGTIRIANIFHRVGETSIKNADDATNGYIIDARVKMNG